MRLSSHRDQGICVSLLSFSQAFVSCLFPVCLEERIENGQRRRKKGKITLLWVRSGCSASFDSSSSRRVAFKPPLAFAQLSSCLRFHPTHQNKGASAKRREPPSQLCSFRQPVVSPVSFPGLVGHEGGSQCGVAACFLGTSLPSVLLYPPHAEAWLALQSWGRSVVSLHGPPMGFHSQEQS